MNAWLIGQLLLTSLERANAQQSTTLVVAIEQASPGGKSLDVYIQQVLSSHAVHNTSWSACLCCMLSNRLEVIWKQGIQSEPGLGVLVISNRLC